MTIFPGKSAKDLYCAIKDKTTKAIAGPATDIDRLEMLVQMKKSLVDVGFSRYRSMMRRWAALDFADKEEFLSESEN